jgi:hypothetical protein
MSLVFLIWKDASADGFTKAATLKLKRKTAMSVKFEIADWKFELTLKELICQPIARPDALREIPVARKAAAELESNNNYFNIYNKEKNNELDFAARR